MDWPDIAKVYDVVAEDYADAFGDELATKPYDLGLLDRYAASLAGKGPVWDVGCGPAGHVTRYLADRGVEASGVDLSPRSVEVARKRQPGLTFRVGDMCDLPSPCGALAGIVAFYSVIHLPRERIPAALGEFARVLQPRGELLLAMHGHSPHPTAESPDYVSSDEWFGHNLSVRATIVTPEEIEGLVTDAGLVISDRHVRDPYDGEYPSRRIYLWATASA